MLLLCDEAHRSQYGFKGRIDQKTGEIGEYGLAKALRDGLPNATFLPLLALLYHMKIEILEQFLVITYQYTISTRS